MTRDMQDRFKTLTKERGVWLGGSYAPQQDLAMLFVIRCAELYLKPGGSFGFIMPRAVLESEAHNAFRRGVFTTKQSSLALSFGVSWDLRDVRSRPAFFPMPAAVVFASLTDGSTSVPLSTTVDQWSGTLPDGNLDLSAALEHLDIARAVATQRGSEPASPYEPRFYNGATLFPRLLVFVEEDPTDDPLGFGVGVKAVRSSRSKQEHDPWKSLPSLSGSVEEAFVHRVYTGAVLLPFRFLPPTSAILPWHNGRLMDVSDEAMASFPHLANWWGRATTLWDTHRTEDSGMTLLQNLDFRHKLSNQFPIAPERVVYSMGGSRLVAARLTDKRGLIEQSLVWMNAQDADEARYLVAILNSRVFAERVAQYQTVGQFGRRHFTKHVFNVPMPLFDRKNALHRTLAKASEKAEAVVASVDLPTGVGYNKGRRILQHTLITEGVADELDTLVADLLSKK